MLAGAQPYSAWLRMEASTDEGATWRDGVVDVERGVRTVRVRVRADWTPEGGYALSRARFDAFVRDAGAGDTAMTFQRPFPFDASFPQTIVGTRFGTTIKIDDSRDTDGPGLGTRAIFSFQEREEGNPDFDSSRPVTVFSYELTLDGTLGTRVADGVILLSPIDSRDLTVWTTPPGGIRVIPATVVPVSIRVVPSPGGAVLAGAGALLVRRRKRAAIPPS